MRIAINGFGRIGERLALRILGGRPSTGAAAPVASWSSDLATTLTVAAINEVDPARHALLCQWLAAHDTARRTTALCVSEPRDLPWNELDVDVVVEASRWFHRDQMAVQTCEGRIPVIMTGDLRDSRPDLTLVLGVNDERYDAQRRILCAGSDRTQSCAPLLALLEQEFGVESYRLALVRPPYAETVGRVYAHPRQAEQLAEVLPTLVGRGAVTRIEDPRATNVRMWWDVTVRRELDESELFAMLRRGERRFPGGLACAPEEPDASGDVRSLLIDASSVRCGGRRAWFVATYDPITSYVERLVEMLRFLSRT